MTQQIASVQVKKQLKALARHWSYPNPLPSIFKPEDTGDELVAEYESGSFDQDDVDAMLDAASDICIDTYIRTHHGKRPPRQ